MGGRKPTLGYPSLTDAVLALRGEDLSTSEIAARIGRSASTVCALEISGAGRYSSRVANNSGRAMFLPLDVLASLRPHAERRGVTVNTLARRIVETVADDDLVDAVLDDGEEDSAEDREAGP